MNIEKTIQNLQSFGCDVQHFATGAEAADYLASQIQNTTVGIGGSKTIEEIGVYERLTETNDVAWHWKDGLSEETFRRAREAKVYLCSPNAISETGEMIFIDGNANRISGITTAVGKTEYFVASTKKICPDLPSAIERARSISPINLKRFPGDRPCAKTDKCVDCHSPNRLCRAFLVLCGKMPVMEKIEVILVDEDLGL